jgi:hypothetical protein
MKTSLIKAIAIGTFVSAAGAFLFVGCGSGNSTGTIQSGGFNLSIQDFDFVSPSLANPVACSYPTFKLRFRDLRACAVRDINNVAAVFLENPSNTLPLGLAYPEQSEGGCIYNFFLNGTSLTAGQHYRFGVYGNPGSPNRVLLGNTMTFSVLPENAPECINQSPLSITQIDGLTAPSTSAPNIGDIGTMNSITGEVTWDRGAAEASLTAIGLSIIQGFINGFFGGTPRNREVAITFSRSIRQSPNNLHVRSNILVKKMTLNGTFLDDYQDFGVTMGTTQLPNDTVIISPSMDGWAPNNGAENGYLYLLLINKGIRAQNGVPLGMTTYVPFVVH